MTIIEANAMEHPQIDDEHVIDRYLAGRLSDAEEQRFEEHLFVCSSCLEQVEAGDEMRRGLRDVAAEEGIRAATALGLWAGLRRRPGSQLAALAALVAVFVTLPAVIWWQQLELSRLRATGGFSAPTAEVQLASLGVTRAEELPELRPDPSKNALVLSLELPPGPAARYSVTLLDATGATLWQAHELTPNLYDSLMVVLPSGFLSPGTYRFRVEDPSRAETPPLQMDFRIPTD